MPIASRYLNAGATLSLLILTGCREDFGPAGPQHTETRSIPLDQTEMVRVELRLGAGELAVRGGASKLMEGEFTYRRPLLRPDVRYDATGSRGYLTVEQPSRSHYGPHENYRWDLQFNDDKPLDMRVNFGAGEGRLDLGSLALRSLEIHMGVGELRLDLRGHPRNDYDVNLRGGVGELTVYLPDGVGIEADAKGGIGGVSARGLRKHDGLYVNDAYGHAKTNVRLDIRGGVGAINLIGG
jgi:hypothetical protein